MSYMKAVSSESTKLEGEKLSHDFKSGKLIFLIGDLGSGKTQFTKGVAKGLEIVQEIVSPTFVIMNEYKGSQLNLIHIDLYRIEDYEDLNFDITELIKEMNVLVVEWADKFINLLPRPD